jgi:DNA-binding MarR family transcriptional regulator
MTVSKSLKKLASLELLNRCECENDTRSKTIELTLKGQNLIKKMVPIVEKIDASFFGILENSEQNKFLKILFQLAKEK